MEQVVVDPISGEEMEDMWNASPEPAASACSAAPPYSTPQPATKALARAQPPPPPSNHHHQGRRNRSPYWAYYDKLHVDGKQKAVCKYCSRQLGCDSRSGTSVLKNHIQRCKAYPPPDHKNCSPATTTLLDPSHMFPAATSVYQMMETMHILTTGRTPWAIRFTGSTYHMRFDFPGFTKHDVRVWVEDDAFLVVEAHKSQADTDDWPLQSFGKYSSRIALPETVHSQNVKAAVRDGVLYITLPKASPTTSGRILIRVH